MGEQDTVEEMRKAFEERLESFIHWLLDFLV
jgi:hypothetical protein